MQVTIPMMGRRKKSLTQVPGSLNPRTPDPAYEAVGHFWRVHRIRSQEKRDAWRNVMGAKDT